MPLRQTKEAERQTTIAKVREQAATAMYTSKIKENKSRRQRRGLYPISLVKGEVQLQAH